MSTFEEGRSSTCFLPRFSALYMVFCRRRGGRRGGRLASLGRCSSPAACWSLLTTMPGAGRGVPPTRAQADARHACSTGASPWGPPAVPLAWACHTLLPGSRQRARRRPRPHQRIREHTDASHRAADPCGLATTPDATGKRAAQASSQNFAASAAAVHAGLAALPPPSTLAVAVAYSCLPKSPH